MRRCLILGFCLILAGCAAVPVEPTPSPSVSQQVTIPDDGVTLESLGFEYAPDGFSVPSSATLSDFVDQPNTVVAVFTAPSGLEIAEYLRANLPDQGFVITEDGNNSLLFERDDVAGAFTSNGAYAGLSLRYDDRS